MGGDVALKLIWTFPAVGRTMDARRRNCSAIATSSLRSSLNAPNNNGFRSLVCFAIRLIQPGSFRSRLIPPLLRCCLSKPFIPRVSRRELGMLRTNRALRYFDAMLRIPGIFMSVATSCVLVGDKRCGSLLQLTYGWICRGRKVDGFTGFTLAPDLGRPTRLFKLFLKVVRLSPWRLLI